MKFSLKGFFYRTLIDPLLAGLRETILLNISSSDKIIDVACGPGTLAIAMAGMAGNVTGIDLDHELISHNLRRSSEKRIKNIHFEVRDASDLSGFRDREFDIAVTSMAIHQFEPQLAIKVLSEMKRIAVKVIVADYNCPMSKGFPASVAHGIEKMAAGDHYRNFKNYMSAGGIKYFTNASGLEIRSSVVRSNGVFVVVICG